MKTFIEEYGKIVVVAIILMIIIAIAPWVSGEIKEHINNTVDKITEGIGGEEEKASAVLMSGSNFNKKLIDSTKGYEINSLQFVKSKTPSTDVAIVDYSQAQDGSIIGWLEDDTYYISSEGKIETTADCTGMFLRVENIKSVKFENLDTSNATDMFEMFCFSGFEDIDTLNLETPNVTNMSRMFLGCPVTKLDLSNFDTYNVTNMGAMMNRCKLLKKIDVSSFVTTKLTNIAGMFLRCESLESLDLSNFDTSNVESMSATFRECKKLKKLDLSNFNVSKVTDMYSMFRECANIETLDLSTFDASKVRNVQFMFLGCYKLTTLDVSTFPFAEMGSGSAVEEIFGYCHKLTTVYTKSYKDSSVLESYGNAPNKINYIERI